MTKMENINFVFKNDRLKLYDSYAYKKKDFSTVLTYIISNDIEGKLAERSMKSLKNEWRVHNLCYNFGILRRKTRDVDFNYDLEVKKKFFAFLYNVIGPIANLMIK